MTARSGLFVAPVPGATPVGMAPTDGRLALAGLLGVTPRLVSGGAVTQSNSNMQFTLAQSVFQLPDTSNAAATFLSPVDSTVLTPAAGPSSGTRVDSIIAKQNNIENSDADSRANAIILAGTPGAPGLPATLPPGYFRYANINVPTNATLASACTVTILSPAVLAPLPINAATYALLSTVTGAAGQQASVLTDGTASNNGTYVWNGSAWKWAAGGLIPIVPTSAVGATISPNGALTFTAASQLSVNGPFTTVFDNYLVLLDIYTQSTASGGTLQLRSAGTIAAGTDYAYQTAWDSGTSLTANSASGGASIGVVPVVASEQSSEIRFFGPALARPTRIKIDAEQVVSPSAMVSSRTTGRHGLSTAYDGFTYTPSAGTITGTCRIYGYNNN